MTTWLPLRSRLAVILVLMFALVSNARWLVRMAGEYPAMLQPDEITRYERRLEPLRASLPARGTLGYLSDPIPDGLSRSESRQHFKKYLLTQYALTPLLVRRNPDADLVVGNFHEPASALRATSLGLVPVGDFGDGIMLFRRREAE